MTPETKAHLLKMEGERISQRSTQGPQGGDEIKQPSEDHRGTGVFQTNSCDLLRGTLQEKQNDHRKKAMNTERIVSEEIYHLFPFKRSTNQKEKLIFLSTKT